MRKYNHLFMLLFSLPIYGIAQENADTTSTSNLNEAIITSYQKNVKIEGAITTVQIKIPHLHKSATYKKCWPKYPVSEKAN